MIFPVLPPSLPSAVSTLRRSAAAARWLVLPCALALAWASPARAADQIPVQMPPEAFPDPSDLVPWPVKGYAEYAPDSVVNVGRWLFDAPAGKHGFVQTQPDGSLAFEDKTPARFWGTTTVYGMTFPDKPEEIARMADGISAAGYNLVRFHHNDQPSRGVGFLQSQPTVSNYLLDPKDIDRLDKLAAELYKRGIYVYVDLVDDRGALAEDGLENWEGLKKAGNGGWKGLFPHPKIVEAWKRATSEFLNHVNPYTGRSWAKEPGVATVEMINENGLFWDWNFKLDDTMRQWHEAQWNAWLVKRYGTREKLDATWTDVGGAKGLFDGEDPAKGTVFMPRLTPLLEWDRPYRSKTRGAARVNDFYAFLADQAVGFYRDGSQYIRGLGFKGVVIGSHELQGPINQFAEVQGAGSIAAHLYANGSTAWNARPTSKGAVQEGVDVKTNNWFANIPRIKVRGAPGINGEWTGGTLTRKADVNVAVAAITAFQNVTQSLHFSYSHRWTRVPVPNHDNSYEYLAYSKKFGNTFSIFHHEPWMAVNRACAPLFVRGDFARPRAKVDIAFSAEDRLEENLHALGINGGSATIGNAATFLPMLHSVECAFFDTAYKGDADVVFMTGRSASGDYRAAKHAVLVGDNPYADHYHKKRDLGAPARLVAPKVKVVNVDAPVSFEVAWPYAAPRTLAYDTFEGAVELASIPAGAQPIGKSADGRYTLGWLDDQRLVLPNGRAYQTKVNDIVWLYRLYLAAAKRWKIDTADNSADGSFYRSDTRELTVDWGTGTLAIDTPRTQGFSGFAGWRPGNAVRNLSCQLDAPYGNVLLTSADNRPIAESRRLLLVAAAGMQNTGAALGKNKNGFTDIVNAGKAPVMVEALRGKVEVRTPLAGQLAVYALDSTGRRLGKVEATAGKGSVSFALSPKWGTIWFELAAGDVEGPAAAPVAGATWPLEEKPRTQPPFSPGTIALNDFFKKANERLSTAAATPDEAGEADDKKVSKDALTRFVARDFAEDAMFRSYGNVKGEIASDPEKGKVLRAAYGKANQDWFGGVWAPLNGPSGAGPADGLGVGFAFKGDGTMPKKAFMTLKTSDGLAYDSKELQSLFETDAWRDVVLKPEDFHPTKDTLKKRPDASPVPAWGSVNRFDFTVSGPLMDQPANCAFGQVFFVLSGNVAPGGPTLGAADLRAKLSPLQPPASVQLKVPFVPGAIAADGRIDEAAWKQALALPMDERKVPTWQFFGSHVVEGKRLREEGANFWMLATPAGLALAAEVHKGSADIVTESGDFYRGDCVEVFTDAANTGGKPTKQIFLAYRRPALDRPAASDGGIQVGRARLADGYVLEAVLPWKSLGFDDVPTAEFGLDFQVDFATKGSGRTLQMGYGTATNEAWINSSHYLKLQISK